ncbi:hypothetical protein HDU98_002360 [Podochytrium sp. JEL0797]|nr:hypothetical protein HDU98_002360 [Podochytrium sp. JEL0797]
MSVSITTSLPIALPTPTPFVDGSKCYAGPGYPIRTVAVQVGPVDKLFTAKTCNTECTTTSLNQTGINYSAVIQSGPFITCYCLIDFKPEVQVTGNCSSCVTYPNHVGYPESDFANCGVSNPSNGYISYVAALPVKRENPTQSEAHVASTATAVRSSFTKSFATSTKAMATTTNIYESGAIRGVLGMGVVASVFSFIL